MLAGILAVTIGSFELFVLLILLSMPVLLTILHIILLSRFKTNRLDFHMTEASILNELAQLENQSKSTQERVSSPST